jgi:hypothetical protein
MQKNGVHISGVQKWCCAVKKVAQWQRYYENLSGYEYNRIVLKTRRWHAVRRMNRRREAGGALPPER